MGRKAALAHKPEHAQRPREAHPKPEHPGGTLLPTIVPGGLVTPESLLGVQRTAGNQAAGRMLGAAGPRVQRLWTTDQFKAKTNAGFLAGRGKTLKQIQKLLDEYHGLRPNGGMPNLGPDMDRSLNILYELKEDTELWLSTHAKDTSRSKNRMPGMREFLAQVGKELTLTKGIREAQSQYLGAEPHARTGNTFKTKMEGTANSVLTKIAPILDIVAPNPGDVGEAEITVDIPVEPTGVGFIGFKFAASVERMKAKATKVRFEVTVTGGAKVPKIFEIKGELGGYLESQGASAAKAMELISYGMYRRFRESKWLPQEMSNFIWGGSTSEVGFTRGSKWAAKVEKENFKKSGTLAMGGSVDANEEGAYVETGGVVGVGAKAGIGGVSDFEGSAKYTQGKHYDFESLKTLKGESNIGKEEDVPTSRGAAKTIGETVHALEIAASVSGGPFSGGLKVNFAWGTENLGAAKLKSIDVTLQAGAKVPINQLVGDGLTGSLPALTDAISRGIRAALMQAESSKRSKSQTIGGVAGALESSGYAFTQLAALPTESFTPAYQAMSPDPLSVTQGVVLSIVGGYDFDKKQWKFEVRLEFEKSLEATTGFVFGAKLKRRSRIIRVTYTNGKWGVD